MRHSHTQRLLDHWRQARGEQLAPRKASIEPRAIKDHLAFAFLLKREADGRSFRLVGVGYSGLAPAGTVRSSIFTVENVPRSFWTPCA